MEWAHRSAPGCLHMKLLKQVLYFPTTMKQTLLVVELRPLARRVEEKAWGGTMLLTKFSAILWLLVGSGLLSGGQLG